jgi:hypothetical protein
LVAMRSVHLTMMLAPAQHGHQLHSEVGNFLSSNMPDSGEGNRLAVHIPFAIRCTVSLDCQRSQ